MLEIAMNLDKVIVEEIEANACRMANALAVLRKDLSPAMREYVESVSEINGVIGIYCGLDGLTVNLLDIVESDDHGVADCNVRDSISKAELVMAEKYGSLNINHRTVGSARKTLDGLEKGNEITGFFMDDEYSGKDVKRIYPLA